MPWHWQAWGLLALGAALMSYGLSFELGRADARAPAHRTLAHDTLAQRAACPPHPACVIVPVKRKEPTDSLMSAR